MSSNDPDAHDIQKIQKYFHNLIRKRATDEFGLDISDLELPILTKDLLNYRDPDDQPYFPVPGMYGGFCYTLYKEEKGFKLVTSSECRICGGSEETHEITVNGTVQVSSGDY
jgi:hypothetical protein